MELVPPECFNGLSEEEKQVQLYLAYYTWAGDDTLLDPDCFLAYPHQEEAIYAALKVHGGTVEPECIEGMSPEERYQAMYEAVYAAAADDTLTHPDCFPSLSPEVREWAFYTALYVIADDVDLVSPECFLGSSREAQREAIYAAVYQITQEPVNPIPALSPMMWLRADALVLEDEDPVDTWPDMSGNGNDASQGTFMQMPTYHASGIGGAPSVSFDGIDDYLQSALTLNQPLTIVSVIKLSSTTGSNPIYDGTTSRVHEYHEPSPGWRLYAGVFGDSGFPITTNSEIHIATYNGASSGLRINGAGASPINSGGNAIGNLRIGTNIDANAWFTGSIAEFVVFGSALTPEQASVVEAYLASKYSITF